jgi:hypothetical protein
VKDTLLIREVGQREERPRRRDRKSPARLFAIVSPLRYVYHVARGVMMQQRRELRKAISLTAAAMVGVLIVRDAESPHVEQREYTEEPCMTFDSPYTTTSAVMLSFPLFGFRLESIPVSTLRHAKK